MYSLYIIAGLQGDRRRSQTERNRETETELPEVPGGTQPATKQTCKQISVLVQSSTVRQPAYMHIHVRGHSEACVEPEVG